MGKYKTAAFFEGERDVIGKMVRPFLDDESPLVQDLAKELLDDLDHRCASGVDSPIYSARRDDVMADMA